MYTVHLHNSLSI